MTCLCNSIGAPQEIRFCDEDGHHAYWYGDHRLTSVSAVIKAIMPPQYEGVDPAVLENARIRGERIDRFFTAYVTTGNVRVEAGERADVVERLSRLIDFWDRDGYKVTTAQKIVHDDHVAGTLDLEINEEYIIDLKCTAELQASYKLQLGGYLTLGGYERAAILHCQKDRVKLVPYDAAECKRIWAHAVAWWQEYRCLKDGKMYQAKVS